MGEVPASMQSIEEDNSEQRRTMKNDWYCSVCDFYNCTAKGVEKPESCVYSGYQNVAFWQSQDF